MNSLFPSVVIAGIFGLGGIANAAEGQDSLKTVAEAAGPGVEAAFVKEANQAVQTKLSTMWTVVALNMIGIDVLSTFIPGKQEEVVDYAGGEKNVKYAMLGGIIVYEIPISMIFLSRYMDRGAGRWVNVGAAALSAATIIGAGDDEPHYLFGATVEILALSYIAWTACKWPDPEAIAQSRHRVGVSVDSRGTGLTYSYAF